MKGKQRKRQTQKTREVLGWQRYATDNPKKYGILSPQQTRALDRTVPYWRKADLRD